MSTNPRSFWFKVQGMHIRNFCLFASAHSLPTAPVSPLPSLRTANQFKYHVLADTARTLVSAFPADHLASDQLSQRDHGQRYPRQFTIVMQQSTQRELSESQLTFASAPASTVKFRLAKETTQRSPVSRTFSPKTRARLT